MINAYSASYLKYNHETTKRLGAFCVIEIQLKERAFSQIIIINYDGLVLAIKAKAITAIKGYRSYTPEQQNESEFGAGGLEKLNTKDDAGMLEGLAKQLQFNYNILTQAFGEALLKLSDL